MKKKILLSVLVLCGLYSAYLVAGLVANAVGIWPAAPGTAMMASDHKKSDKSTADNDGPHVFYENKRIVVRSVVGHNKAATVVIDTVAIGDKAAVLLNCTFSRHPEWNFTTHLKANLHNEAAVYNRADSIIALSDVEGNFKAFRALLIQNGVMNSRYQWTFGSGHLALVGDLFDRGLHVTECLWLIYHLEGEAEQAGGKVHFVLGNHDIANLSGKLREVRNKYIENAKRMHVDYTQWYTSNTELGRWLRTKNVVEKVGGVLIVHGGISKQVNALSMSLLQINDLCRRYYDTDDDARQDELEEPAKTLYSQKASPFWYRGYVGEEATKKQLAHTLKMYNISAIIVGHTVVDSVETLYGGRVMAIDTKHAEGISQGVLYTGGVFYRIDDTGKRLKL